jgi:hypothetical protein
LRVRARTNIKVNQCRPSRIVGGETQHFSWPRLAATVTVRHITTIAY